MKVGPSSADSERPPPSTQRNAKMMSRFLGKARSEGSSSVPREQQEDPESTVLSDIADSKELLSKREAHLQHKLEQELKMAVSYKEAGQKRLAIGCLKRKKMIEAELDSIHEQRLRTDTLEHTLTSLKFSSITLETERRATAAIKAKMRKMGGIDQLEEHRADTEETLEDAYEMLGIAAQPVNNPTVTMDDDELLEELEQMSQDAVEKEEDERALRTLSEVRHLDGAGPSIENGYLQLPPVPPKPSHELRKQQQQQAEMAELEQLTASMAMEMPMPMLGMAPPIPMIAMHA